MSKGGRRISDADMSQMVRELDRWALGQLGSRLTWEILEKRFGFSRQSLQAKPIVKAAYDLAKAALSGGLVKSKEKTTQDNGELSREVERLRRALEAWELKDVQWKQRYQRIAFHIRQNGRQLYDRDKKIGEDRTLPTERETVTILRPFDKEIPPSGRV
jgi:hypothetical protein